MKGRDERKSQENWIYLNFWGDVITFTATVNRNQGIGVYEKLRIQVEKTYGCNIRNSLKMLEVTSHMHYKITYI